MLRLALAAFLISTQAFCLYNIGDKTKNYCWLATPTSKVCLDDFKGTIVVLLYNAGWCGPCRAEFTELVPLAEKFAGKKVTFISLSMEAWRGGSDANDQFLHDWKIRFGINRSKAKWVVAASPRDPGRDFLDEGMIPSVVVLNTEGKVSFKAVSPGSAKIISEIERLKP